MAGKPIGFLAASGSGHPRPAKLPQSRFAGGLIGHNKKFCLRDTQILRIIFNNEPINYAKPE
jgi:hypothetical protein